MEIPQAQVWVEHRYGEKNLKMNLNQILLILAEEYYQWLIQVQIQTDLSCMYKNSLFHLLRILKQKLNSNFKRFLHLACNFQLYNISFMSTFRW